MGGVACLGSVFCRSRKIKSAVVDDAIVIKKYGHDNSYTELINTVSPARNLGGESALISPADYIAKNSVLTCVNLNVCSDVGGRVHVCHLENNFVQSDDLGLERSFEFGRQMLAYRSGSDEDEIPTPFDTRPVPALSGEAEYEGEDEHEDGGSLRESDADRLHSDVASDKGISCQFSQGRDVHDKESVIYYETPANCNYAPSVSDSGFVGLEIGSGHISDPGVYHATKDLESAFSSPLTPHLYCPEGAEKDVNLQADSLSAPSELGGLLPGSLNADSTHQLVLSFGSGSSTDVGRDRVELNTVDGGVFTLINGINGSESILQSTSEHTTRALVSQKKNPWWKVFLTAHRNIHRGKGRGIAGPASEGGIVELSPLNGYASDVDSGARLSLPSVRGFASDIENSSTERVVENGGLPPRSDQQDEEAVEHLANGILGLIESEDESRCLQAHPIMDSPGRRHGFFGNNDTLSRVEQWVSSVEPLDDETQAELHKRSDGPSVSGASFFATRHSSVPQSPVHFTWTDVEETRQGPSEVDPAMELAQRLVRQIGISAVASYPCVGLKFLPSLGAFSCLKTLNLSSNGIVRITPGCLPRSLHSLDLSRNKITAVEGLRESARLRCLNLSFNRILRIGNGLSSCMSLRELYLAGNKISEVEGLHRLSKLTVLDLSFNKLTTTKSLGQIAANYKSLLALNLLGNAVHSNLGDEQLRRFANGVCPQLTYLNKVATKSALARDSAVASVARAGMSAVPGSRGIKSSSKTSKREKVTSTAGVPSHRRSNSGGVSSGHGSKHRSKGTMSPAAVHRSHKSPEGDSRRSHHSSSRPHERANGSKELPRGSNHPLPLPSNNYIAEKGMGLEGTNIHRVKSEGALYEDNTWNVSPGQVGDM